MSNKLDQPKLKHNWEATAYRYVCFIDIMGFTNMVATREHSEVYKMMERIIEIQISSSSMGWGEGSADLVKTTTYSDSIIIFSCDSSIESLNAIVCTVSAITNDFLTDGVPHKGAMSFGEMTCDVKKSIYFGQPLIDSYLLQDELFFYGIVVHGSAQKEIENHNHNIFIDPYHCPLKKGRTHHLVIPPMFLGIEKYKDKNSNLLKAINNMKYSTSGYLRMYIDATKDYIEHMNNKNKAA